MENKWLLYGKKCIFNTLNKHAMAISDNPLLHRTSGSIGDLLVVKKYYDKTVISKKPDMSKRVLSEKQKEANERMVLANDYAKFYYRSEEEKLKARIRLKLPAHKSLYHALVKEHLDQNRHLSLEEADRLLNKLIMKG